MGPTGYTADKAKASERTPLKVKLVEQLSIAVGLIVIESIAVESILHGVRQIAKPGVDPDEKGHDRRHVLGFRFKFVGRELIRLQFEM